MIETNMEDVKEVYLDQSMQVSVENTPCAFVEFAQEVLDSVGTGMLEERESLQLFLNVTFTVTKGSESEQLAPNDQLDDLKWQLREMLKDDNFLMYGIPGFDREGSRAQGLSTGVQYLSTTPTDSDEGTERMYSYVLKFVVPYEDNSIPDYRLDDMTGWTAYFTDPEDQEVIRREAEGTLE
jgi:hypothetical protein